MMTTNVFILSLEFKQISIPQSSRLNQLDLAIIRRFINLWIILKSNDEHPISPKNSLQYLNNNIKLSMVTRAKNRNAKKSNNTQKIKSLRNMPKNHLVSPLKLHIFLMKDPIIRITHKIQRNSSMLLFYRVNKFMGITFW